MKKIIYISTSFILLACSSTTIIATNDSGSLYCNTDASTIFDAADENSDASINFDSNNSLDANNLVDVVEVDSNNCFCPNGGTNGNITGTCYKTTICGTDHQYWQCQPVTNAHPLGWFPIGGSCTTPA